MPCFLFELPTHKFYFCEETEYKILCKSLKSALISLYFAGESGRKTCMQTYMEIQCVRQKQSLWNSTELEKQYLVWPPLFLNTTSLLGSFFVNSGFILCQDEPTLIMLTSWNLKRPIHYWYFPCFFIARYFFSFLLHWHSNGFNIVLLGGTDHTGYNAINFE